jgi:uncharacterized iron-regulated protein
MAEAGQGPAVGLEMVPTSRQKTLDAFNRGELSLRELPEALDWQESWGYPFDLYAPVFAAAREHALPVYGLNVPPEVVKDFSDKGREGLSEEQRGFLPDTIIPPSEEQQEVLMQVFEQHQKLGNATDPDAPQANAGEDDVSDGAEEAMERFFRVQSLWDTAMAAQAVRVHGLTGRPVAVLTGAGHVEYGWGLGHRLRTLDPDAGVLLVMPWRGGQSPDAEAADVFYHCPMTHTSRLGFSMEQEEQGLNIADVDPGSPADKAGLLAGDLLLEAGGREVRSLWDLHRAGVAAAREDTPLELVVRRDGERKTLRVEVGSVAGRPSGDPQE